MRRSEVSQSSATQETQLSAYNQNLQIKVVHKQNKDGLNSAILEGVKFSTGRNIMVMDADFSHPPKTIPKMIEHLAQDPNCIVIASRYICGGSTEGWPMTRRVVSAGAVNIARYFLMLRNVRDPISGFFALPRNVIESIDIGTKGYKILLEILIKSDGSRRIKEIPYTFTDRRFGESKFNLNVIFNFIRAAWLLYRYKKTSRNM